MHRLFILLLPFFSFSQLPESDIGSTKHTIESLFLGYDHDIWISLPDDYDTLQSYPVLYVLDAEWRFDITRALARELAINDECPHHIIVGIPQIDWQHRFKNLTFTPSMYNHENEYDSTSVFNKENTSGGEQYLKFLEGEVAAYINYTYNTNGFDMLIGHSLGGYYCAYLLDKSTKFEAYQILDPSIWYNRSDVLHHLRKELTESNRANVFVSYAQGGEERDTYFLTAVDSLCTLLKEKGNINYSSKFYPDEYHNSMYMYGVIEGLKFIYDGYSFGFIHPDDNVVADDYTQHFNRFSEKVNFTFLPNKDGYRWIGYANYTQQRWHEALQAYHLLGDAYDMDAFLLTEIGDCYHGLKRDKKALYYYERVLEMEPENAQVLAKVKLLENK